MLCKAVESYLDNPKSASYFFFYAVGDEKYLSILNELEQRNVVVNRISEFCSEDDKIPNIDEVISHFKTLGTDDHRTKHVLIGLGEYLALKGPAYTEKVLIRLLREPLGTARVILLLRCVAQQVKALQRVDHRILEQNRLFIDGNTGSSVSVICTNYPSQKDAIGVKKLLQVLEKGRHSSNIYVKSALDFPQSLVPVHYIRTAFEAIQQVTKGLKLEESMGKDDQWERFYKELQECDCSLDNFFARYGYTDNFEEDIYEKFSANDFENWVFYLSLKHYIDRIQNKYLAYVIVNTDSSEDLRKNLLTAIVNVVHSDERFQDLYTERKKLIKGFPDSDIQIFIRENQINPKESIYRYTDNTEIERKEIIAWIAQYGYIDEIKFIYPALALYLGDYKFDCGSLSKELTEYFKEYRFLKVTNQIPDKFLAKVERNAKERPYTHLETRNNVILSIPNKANVFLLWIDALGVEYLPYIRALAAKKGLSMHVDITYVQLPTITSINKSFYENWSGQKKDKESRLDEIKHKEEGGYNYEPGQAPFHLVAELEVIRMAIDRAATELFRHTCKSFVIASDHGASRLAVLHRQEEKYDTDTKGEHSGRCCKEFPDADLPQAIRENGYLVLADYGRFKNSRAANVEVHGGASLEEVIVPIITLSQKRQSHSIVKLLEKDAVFCDRRQGTTICIYISEVDNPNNVSVEIDGNRYTAKAQDATHYEINLTDMRRAKKNVSATIFDGGDLIGEIHFDIKGKMAKVSEDFDDLF